VADDKLAPSDISTRPYQRVVTMELARRFAELLAGDVTHTVESVASVLGVRACTIRQALSRFERDRCSSEEDEEICAVLAAAKERHIHELRRTGFLAAGNVNGPGANWLRWQLEVQDPVNHPRQNKTSVELSGPNGGPVRLGVTEMTTEELLEVIRETDPP
jgi:hypothetical protein